MDLSTVLDHLVAKMDASMLLLLIISYGVWVIINKIIAVLSAHGSAVVGELKGIRSELSNVVSTVAVHEVRIAGLESCKKLES